MFGSSSFGGMKEGGMQGVCSKSLHNYILWNYILPLVDHSVGRPLPIHAPRESWLINSNTLQWIWDNAQSCHWSAKCDIISQRPFPRDVYCYRRSYRSVRFLVKGGGIIRRLFLPNKAAKPQEHTNNIPCDLESLKIRYRADSHWNPISESQNFQTIYSWFYSFFIAHGLLYFRI
jgi:hypothetical protein